MRFWEWLTTLFGAIASAFLAGITTGGLKQTFAIMSALFCIIVILITVESICDITVKTEKENDDA